jgi:hypothetical protein
MMRLISHTYFNTSIFIRIIILHPSHSSSKKINRVSRFYDIFKIKIHTVMQYGH